MARAATFAGSLSLAGWLIVAALFIGLRFDNSERTYFLGDDQLVVALVDEIVKTGHWQPDWNRVTRHFEYNNFTEQENQRTGLPHEHHYNFSGQILLGACLVNAVRATGHPIPTAALLHHLVLLLDGLSLLFVIGCARQLGNAGLAFCAAIIYSLFPLAVQGSHYARPDALLTCAGSALLWLGLRGSQMTTGAWLLANAVTLAITISTKASQVMMGIYPAIALTQLHLSGHRFRQLLPWVNVTTQGTILLTLLLGLLTLVFASADITLNDFVISTRVIMNYYHAPAPPDQLEHYSYFTQLGNILAYFYATLGAPLLLAIAVGTAALLKQQRQFVCAMLCLPLLLFTAYFASVPAFFDRSFCPSAGAMALLAAIGITHITAATCKALPMAIALPLLTLLFSYQPITINYHLQTDHLRNHFNDDRLAFQKSLKEQWPGFWLKNIDRTDMFSLTLPEKPPKNPRIYVAEDFNDWNSRVYAQLLRDHGFVQIAEFTGDFHAIPTSSLLTVHEAARFRYFIRKNELPSANAPPSTMTPTGTP